MLAREFYARDTKRVAEDLLGKFLIHKSNGEVTGGRIVETEAYYGQKDPASRATKKTKISEIMWGQAGFSLVYMVHANWLFNVTTEEKGVPGAVLIRALEPRKGIEVMKRHRRKENIKELTSGPGKLTQALNITKKDHGIDLTKSEDISMMKIEKSTSKIDIGKSHRIGVSEDLNQKLRFFVEGCEHVSQ